MSPLVPSKALSWSSQTVSALPSTHLQPGPGAGCAVTPQDSWRSGQRAGRKAGVKKSSHSSNDSGDLIKDRSCSQAVTKPCLIQLPGAGRGR